jgi:tetratricopeptide (TPR) repeat protein
VCRALRSFLDFIGRWDEWVALSRDAEAKAVAAKDFWNAGWRAHTGGWVYFLRGQSTEMLTHADRAEAYWRESQATGAREQATALHLRGIGHRLAKDYPAAIAALREAVELWRILGLESEDVTIGLETLANVERASGDIDAAERDYREALRISKAVGISEGVASLTGNLAALALDSKDWPSAEAMAREALTLAEKVGRMELIAENCLHLVNALARQGRKQAALLHARRAVEIYAALRSPELEKARQTLAECES